MTPSVKKWTRRVFPGFSLQFPVADIQLWADRYPPEDNSPFEAGRRITDGDYDRANLRIIVNWKSKRRAALIDKNSDGEITEALRLAVEAQEARTAFAVLMGLSGVGLPMASAILACLDGKQYTIIDWRTLEALGAPNWNADLNFYLTHYLPECRRLARAAEVSLRTLDRALWQWSRENGG